MIIVTGGVLYLLFASIIAFLLKSKKVGFWAMFFLSIVLTPLLVAVIGITFSKDQIK